MYNDEFNNNDMYRFTNREVPRDDYAPAPRQENTYTAPVRKQGLFHRTWVKVTALVLACAVVGGAAGYGGAALAKGGSGSGTAIKEKAWGCGGRSEKHLPWLKQAAASASAPVSVHAVLLTDNGDERLCPREDAGNHSRP